MLTLYTEYLMVGIIDLNLGNIGSWINILEDFDLDFKVISSNTHNVDDFDLCILPGVGVYNVAVDELDKRGLREFIIDFSKTGKKIVGICLGMQLLFETSEEAEGLGLNLIPGKVKSFEKSEEYKQMRMEWGPVKFFENTIFESLSIQKYYFCHRYFCVPENPEHITAVSFYGKEYTCMANKGNIYGIQFHPEKSGKKGMELLKIILEQNNVVE